MSNAPALAEPKAGVDYEPTAAVLGELLLADLHVGDVRGGRRLHGDAQGGISI